MKSHWRSPHWLGASTNAPSTPALTVVDNADNTGATATVSEGSTTATHYLYALRVTGVFPTEAWTLIGTRTGNGTIPATVEAGYYWWRVDASEPPLTGTRAGQAVSNLIYLRVTTGDDPVQQQLMDASEARVNLLALDGVIAVYQRELVPDGNILFPCVLLTYDEQLETRLGGTTGKDDRGRPISLGILDVDVKDETFKKRTQSWRQSIDRAFQGWVPSDVSEVMTCDVEYGAVIRTETDGQKIYKISDMLLRFRCREARGLGA